MLLAKATRAILGWAEDASRREERGVTLKNKNKKELSTLRKNVFLRYFFFLFAVHARNEKHRLGPALFTNSGA